MKKLIALLLALILLALAFVSCNKDTNAAEPNPASDFEYRIDGDQVSITKYIGTDKTVVIPEVIEGKIVTSIKAEAFAHSSITECILPYTVRIIEALAFAGCADLEKITLNEGLITIEDGAFCGESKLTEITIPSTVTQITENAFSSVLGLGFPSTLKKVLFEGDAPVEFLCYPILTDIDFTIYYHSDAKGFTFPRWNGYSTRIIDSDIAVPIFEDFEYEENGNGDITILAYVGTATDVTVPESINGKSVTEIGFSAFENNHTIVAVALPNTVKTVAQRAFRNCKNLTTVTLSNTLTTIESYCFDLCRNLASITLPDTLTVLGEDAFRYTSSLKQLTIPCDISEGAFSYSGLESVAFKEGLQVIGAHAFSNTQLTTVALPNSVTEIQESAFTGCRNLKKISFNEGLTTIGNTAFFGAPVKEISLPSTIKNVGEYAFANCESLKQITLNQGLEIIGDYAFEDSASLSEIIIPSTVTNVDESAFKGCAELEAVKFEGNAPGEYENEEANINHISFSYIVYYHEGAEGFTSPVWCGYETAIW